MKIFNKDNFSELPDYFWINWNEKNQSEIIKTSYPLFLVRVGICHKDDESEFYSRLWKLKESLKDAIFIYDFTYLDRIIFVHLNTIHFYADTAIDKF